MITLLSHQVDAMNQTKDQNRVAYYLDMGLGKTFVGSEKMMQLGKRVNLLICQKSKVDDWIEHFDSHYHILVFDLTNKTAFESFFKRINDCDHKVIGIINYELTFRRKDLLQLKDFTLMLDESSLIQNEKTKRSKFVLKLEPENLILLSGTPTGGKYEKLFSQLHLLGWNITKELYWKQYIETEWFETDDGYFMKKIVGYKNVERLKAKLRQHGAIFMKSEEVFDLPEQIHINVNVPVTKEYRKFLQKRLVSIDNVELVGDTILTFRLYQRMLCGQYNTNKLEAFKDLIDSSDDRFIVFYNFNEELDRMVNLVEDRPVSIVNGSVKDLSAFESEPNSITFIQYQAGAMGLNLQKANKIIYFTPPDGRSELFEQSKKRTHRIGQTETCFYYHLIVSDSIEERIHENLLMLRDYTDDLFKQDYLKGRELNE